MFGFANPKRFSKISTPIALLSSLLASGLIAYGLYLALIVSPPDYQQHDSVRIMYVHVPAAWLSMLAYASLAVAALFFLVSRHTLAGLYIRAAAPVGAAFTAICLISGALWGQPTWGTWWVWDARLTSVLILFFLYLGVIALMNAFDNPEKGEQSAAWLVIVGSVNLPIIKFSVDWWNTLHQSSSISSLSKIMNPSIDSSMLTPLLIMAGGFLSLFAALSVLRLDNEIMARRLHVARMKVMNA